jgi:hypothetical protein
MTRPKAHLALAAMTLLLMASTARSSLIDIVLMQTSETALAGSTIEFDATLTNLSATDTVFLNGDSTAASSAFLMIDDLPFLINAPFFLDPGASSGPFALFNVIIDAATPPGTYDFNFFQIFGGLDSNAFDTIGSAMFSVIVSAPVFSVPEPAPLWLVAAGLVAVGFARGRGLNSRRAGSAASVQR